MSSRLSGETVVRRLERVPFARLDDELLAIDAESGYLYSLNETAGSVWNAISGPVSVRDLCIGLVEAYQVDETTCEAGVIPLLEQLCAAGLVEIVNETR